MSKYLHLQIPQSCHENWQTMLPEEQGRFCLSCQKKVVDFTALSDREVVHFFQQADQPLCGRFTASQLNRKITIPPKPLPWIGHLIRFSLPAFLLSLKASGQVSKVEVATQQAPVAKEHNEVIVAASTTLNVEGVVEDEQGQPIPFASIVLKGTNRGVQADSAGYFNFEEISTPATLVVSAVGFHFQEVLVNPGLKTLQVRMQLGAVLMGEVVVVGTVAVKKTTKKDRIALHKSEEKQRLLVYPNPLPAGTALRLQCQKLDRGTYILGLYNSSGMQVHSEKMAYDKNMAYLQVQVPALAAGNYFLKLTHEQKGKSYQEQIVVTL